MLLEIVIVQCRYFDILIKCSLTTTFPNLYLWSCDHQQIVSSFVTTQTVVGCIQHPKAMGTGCRTTFSMFPQLNFVISLRCDWAECFGQTQELFALLIRLEPVLFERAQMECVMGRHSAHCGMSRTSSMDVIDPSLATHTWVESSLVTCSKERNYKTHHHYSRSTTDCLL